MNYLSHYFLNHHVAGIEAQPGFVLGVALPDLWRRYSTTHRIRWKHVGSGPRDHAGDESIRLGLLNHAEADRRFHALPAFIEWQRDLKRRFDDRGLHSALLDFLTHVSIELTLDRQLIAQQPTLVDDFYAHMELSRAPDLDTRLAAITGTQTAGLHEIVALFLSRRFLAQYPDPRALAAIIQRLLTFIRHPVTAPTPLLLEMLDKTLAITQPERVWEEMRAAGLAE